MYASTILSVFALVAASAAAPAPYDDPTVCAPGTGYYQVCAATGYKGCCQKDVCGMKLDYCPPGPASPYDDPTVCKPGTGYYQVCAATGYKGCCTQDVCGQKLSYCPTYYAKERREAAPYDDPTVCAPGTGYYQVCAATGYKGCCQKDVCGMKLDYCPSGPASPYDDPTVCKPGTGYYQVCAATGYKGCCTKDVCGMKLNYCPA